MLASRAAVALGEQQAAPPPAPPAAAPAGPPAPPPPAVPGTVPMTTGRTRVALVEFSVEGDAAISPATSMQLQDGFSIGLLRGGVDLIVPTDVKKRLAAAPELEGCQT